jgi:hypothetical protein
LTVAPASWHPPQLKVAFDGEREGMAPPLRFRISARPLWLVAPSTLIRDDAPAAALADGAPARHEAPASLPAEGLLPA